MDYDPCILDDAPRTLRHDLERSARTDGHRRHSMLSLAVELNVYPHRVLDGVHLFMAKVSVQERADADALLRAAYTGPRTGGSFELPDGHCEGDRAGDMYLTDDAVAYVLESIRPPTFVAASAVTGGPSRRHG